MESRRSGLTNRVTSSHKRYNKHAATRNLLRTLSNNMLPATSEPVAVDIKFFEPRYGGDWESGTG